MTSTRVPSSIRLNVAGQADDNWKNLHLIDGVQFEAFEALLHTSSIGSGLCESEFGALNFGMHLPTRHRDSAI